MHNQIETALLTQCLREPLQLDRETSTATTILTIYYFTLTTSNFFTPFLHNTTYNFYLFIYFVLKVMFFFRFLGHNVIPNVWKYYIMGMISRKITNRLSKENIQICLISRFPLKSSGGNIRDINLSTEGKKEKEKR